MELPAPLSPWREWLAWFSPELVPALGELLRRLHPLVGQFRGSRAAGEPQPDGLGDLHRRGPYERLLASEWLFADEIPDEFLRRAAAGEHLFLAPRPRARQTEKLVLALFDTGPRQLGGPRLVQLALWILLARRAREAGGALRWGVLQASPVLREALDAGHLRQLLKARTYASAGVAHLQAWRQWLADNAVSAAEIWLIGCDLPAATLGHSGGAHQVVITPSLEDEALDVCVSRGVAVRRISLPQPDDKPATRLLKGQFQRNTPALTSPHRASLHSLSIVRPPVISWQGKRVAVSLLEEHGAMVFPIPKPGAEHAGKPRRQLWSSGASPLSLMFSGKTLGAMLSGGDRLTFWQLSQLSTRPLPPREVLEAPPGRANFLPAAWLRRHPFERLYVLDRAGRLVFWQAGVSGSSEGSNSNSGGVRCLDEHVLELAQVANDCFVYVRRGQEQLFVQRVRQHARENWNCALGAAPEDSKILFGGGPLWHKGIGGVAVRQKAKPSERWRLHTPSGDAAGRLDMADVTLESGWQGIGLIHEPEERRFGLLALGPQRDSLALYSGQREALYTTSSRIAKFSVCPVNGLIAMLTVDKEMIVYSVAERQVRLIVNGRGIEHANG